MEIFLLASYCCPELVLQATHDLLDHVVCFFIGKGAGCVLQNQAYADAFSSSIHPPASVKVENFTGLERFPQDLGYVFS